MIAALLIVSPFQIWEATAFPQSPSARFNQGTGGAPLQIALGYAARRVLYFSRGYYHRPEWLSMEKSPLF